MAFSFLATSISDRTKKKKDEIKHFHIRDAQKRSLLFRIPQEMRHMIYAELFFDTRLSHGITRFDERNRQRIIPVPNALSILRSCSCARAEIRDSWLGQVLFNFEGTKTMMIKLAPLPIPTLSKIRHLRIRGETLKLNWPKTDDNWREDGVYYRLVQAFKLLPGLQLDTLTVLAIFGSYESYDVLNTLIRYGQGWKELRFISPKTLMLGYYRQYSDQNRDGERYRRKAQPTDWIQAMNDRDGVDSQPSVIIYQSTLPSRGCTVTNEATRVLFEQEPPKSGEESGFIYDSWWDIVRSGVGFKELMVVVRRGRGIDYQEKLGSPLLTAIGDIRIDCPGMTWAEIKEQHIDWVTHSDDLGMYDGGSDHDCEDITITKHDVVYKGVDYYEWTDLIICAWGAPEVRS